MTRGAAPAFSFLATLLLAAPASSQMPCDAPDAGTWVRDLRDRVLRFDGMASFAVQEYGDPVACEGGVTMEFDGANYGTLLLQFAGDVTLRVETQPLETSIVTLHAESGFADPSAVENALRDYAAGIGVAIDWERPGVSGDGAESVETFHDPDPGLNASAALTTQDGRLVAVRFSMAL